MNTRPAVTFIVMVVACCATQPAHGSGTIPAADLPVEVTVDTAANMRFSKAVNHTLLAMQSRMQDRLCHPLLPRVTLPPTRPAYCEGTVEKGLPPAITQVVVLREGQIWRWAMSHPAQFEQRWPVGSLSKAIIALPLLAIDGARPDERWCPQAIDGLHNADGGAGVADCHISTAELSATAAMAKSNNLATIWRLKRVPLSHLRNELVKAGLQPTADQIHPAVAAALGMIELTPRQALECFDALASGQARRAAMTSHARAPASPFAQWCAKSATTPAARRFVLQMLTAPAVGGGTAAFVPGLRPNVGRVLAKTGTPTNDQGHATAKHLLTSFKHGGVRYTSLVSITAPKPAWPLGTALSAIDLKELVGVIAHSLDQAHPTARSTHQPKNLHGKS